MPISLTDEDSLASSKAEQILAGAMAVFLTGGYAGTSMDRVAAEAGVSKHTIYSHFNDKEGLFNALIERLVLRRFHIEFGESVCELPLDSSPEQVLHRLASILLKLREDPEYIAFFRLLIAESGRFPELAQLYYQKVIQEGNRVLSTYFRNHPDLDLDQLEARSHIFFGSLVCHILAQEVLHGKHLMPLPDDSLVDCLIKMVLSPPASA
ncbi:MAG: TetR/AcrR family transcriptional regulator [Cyanobacteria bacterium Co-bin13]|nr:TetR/AcrR family transcriptional regulator [Cyanobacteria bacterium Co-bin13]